MTEFDAGVEFKLGGNVVGGTDNAELTAAINALDGYTATEDSGTITITNTAGEPVELTDFAETGTGTSDDAAATFTDTDSNTTDVSLTVESGSEVLSARASATKEVVTLTSSEDLAVDDGTDKGLSATAAFASVDDIDLSTATGSQDALSVIDDALAQIDSQRAGLGAVQNRFGHTINNLANIQENVSASRSRIQDTDFATETAQMTKNQILQQAGTSILSQANQIPQAAISLLGG
ncbi:flagellin FliC [Pseudoalteromonas sp. 2CM36K]|nr:flagellin FliC [Pseudoalteromonas sp. 2CM36K]